MQHRRRTGLTAAVLGLALAAPAAAQESTTYFFRCAGAQPAMKYQNTAAGLAHLPWSTTAPAGSFTAGDGCGFLDTPPVNGDRLSDHPGNQWDAWFRGSHDGDVGSVTVELHELLVSRARTNRTREIEVRLTEGEGFDHKTLLRYAGPVTPVLSATGLTEKFVVQLDGPDLEGFEGRAYTLMVHSLEQAPAPWVHGASEVPASITFHPPVAP